MMCGGTSDAKPATAEIKVFCEMIREDLEAKAGKSFAEFTPHSYTSQVVAGTNFFVKIHVGEGTHYHVRIFRPLPGQGDAQLHSHEGGKTQEDPITYF